LDLGGSMTRIALIVELRSLHVGGFGRSRELSSSRSASDYLEQVPQQSRENVPVAEDPAAPTLLPSRGDVLRMEAGTFLAGGA
jgi:hypothetical protein